MSRLLETKERTGQQRLLSITQLYTWDQFSHYLPQQTPDLGRLWLDLKTSQIPKAAG